MAVSPLSLLTAFTKGAVDRSIEIDTDAREEAEKRKKTSLAFASEAYKADLERYNRLSEMKDSLAMSGQAGFASALASNYKIKDGKGRDSFVQSISGQMNKDPEYMNKVLNVYGKISKPSPKDYFPTAEYDKTVGKRIGQENIINRLLFNGRKGPNRLTSKQLRSREEELLSKVGGEVDITEGFHEEMSRLGVAVDAVSTIDPGKSKIGKLWTYATNVKKLTGEAAQAWAEKAGEDTKDGWKVRFVPQTIDGVTTETPVQYRLVGPDQTYEQRDVDTGRVRAVKETKIDLGRDPYNTVIRMIESDISKYEGTTLEKAFDFYWKDAGNLQAFAADAANMTIKSGETASSAVKELMEKKVQERFEGTRTPTSEEGFNEVIRYTSEGKKAVFDKDTKKFLRYEN